MQTCDISPLPYTTLHSQLSINLVQQVKIEGCEEMQFKQRTINKVLTSEIIPPINIHHCMQAVYGDICVDGRTVRCWIQQFKQEVGEALV